jgi:hypothetical protein
LAWRPERRVRDMADALKGQGRVVKGCGCLSSVGLCGAVPVVSVLLETLSVS